MTIQNEIKYIENRIAFASLLQTSIWEARLIELKKSL